MNTSDKPSFSVIICSVNALRFAHVSACFEDLLADFPHEIIGVHDAKSLAEGYNRALRRARGDIAIFSHDDILILDPDFGLKISSRLQDFDILGFAGTRRVIAEKWWNAGLALSYGAVANPYGSDFQLSVWSVEPWPVADNIQGIDGLCIMARREVAEETGFDETTFDGFHLYDLDFSFSAWKAGRKLGVCSDIPIIHASTGDYGKEHSHYGRLFIEKHRDALPANAQKFENPDGLATLVADYRAIRQIWQEDFFRRAMTSMKRKEAL
ncbi:MAG: glycosyltransferase family protein [Betaproteobacteria bacterium]|nr:glycosyltransferase family protein [Betaproteobacteria bacterium]